MEASSRYNPRDIEPGILQDWLASDSFSAKTSKAKHFSIVIPPPNVTGILHMGHALNNTIQDVLVRYKRMKGYETLWMPGTDHAGIATQNVVEKALAKEGKRKEDIGRQEFLKRLWAWKDEYGSTIVNQLKKLGASCDWERLRFTMDDQYSAAVNKAFVLLWKKKLIYQGNYIINWCPRCKTALADEEAPHRDKEGFLYYINYPLKNGSGCLTVATTRPETMLGDVAVAVNPKDGRFKEFLGKIIILPLAEREIKVIADDFVDREFGTGAVKVTPAHDPNDFQIGLRHKLKPILVMNPDATMNSAAGEFAEMDRFEAREVIVEALKKRGLIEKIVPHNHTVGHCYRCDTVIEPYLSKQWFVKMAPLAKPAIKAVKKGEIKFHPQRWEKVYLNWMENIRDWCISRQIWWGHRIPVYYCADCSEAVASEAKPESCSKCKGKNLTQDPDVLDTWFSSWLWPFATLGWPDKKCEKELKYFYPTDILVTAPEIIFFWVARMIMAGFEFQKEKPFSDIYIHGTVRDSKGKKMSKSLGNTIDPLEIIDKFGADALRFSLMLLAASGSDVYLTEDKFLVGRNFCNKIWNAARFILLKSGETKLKVDEAPLPNLDAVDNWVLGELNETIREVSSSLDKYLLNEAVKKIYDFFWHTFCDWYIEIIKNDFTADKDRVALRVLKDSLKLLHPVMPFITEELYSLLAGASIVKSTWPEPEKLKPNKELKLFEAAIETVKQVRNIKADLGMAQAKVKLEISATDVNLKFLETVKSWVNRLTYSSEIIFFNRNKGQNLKRTLYTSSFCDVNLGLDEVNLDNFLTTLDKKITKLNNICNGAEKLLRNENFLEKASLEKVKQEKENWKGLKLEITRLKDLRKAFK